MASKGSELTSSLSPSAKIGLCSDRDSGQAGQMASAFWPVSFRLEWAVWRDQSHGETAGVSTWSWQKTVIGCRRNFANLCLETKEKVTINVPCFQDQKLLASTNELECSRLDLPVLTHRSWEGPHSCLYLSSKQTEPNVTGNRVLGMAGTFQPHIYDPLHPCLM